VTTRLCLVGGVPARTMAGLLFVRASLDVTVLEQHADFLRDFRGETIHPSGRWTSRASPSASAPSPIQSRVIAASLAADVPFRAPLALRLLDALPRLQVLPARRIGMYVRPEHVRVSLRA
jgi:hypothetical protein